MSSNEVFELCERLKYCFYGYVKDNEIHIETYNCKQDFLSSPYGYLQYYPKQNKFIIKYNPSETKEEIINTILHEFSHIVLGHLNKYPQVLGEHINFNTDDKNPAYLLIEHQANLLMVVLRDLWLKTNKEIKA